MSEQDSSNWLHRLSADEWLSAARGELLRALQALRAGQRRQGVAQARRASGMALNAVLHVVPDESWGRSYREHLEALGRAGEPIPLEVREAAKELLAAPLEGPRLIRLGKNTADDGLASAAATIVDWAQVSVAEGRLAI